jgi:hypothetical protein
MGRNPSVLCWSPASVERMIQSSLLAVSRLIEILTYRSHGYLYDYSTIPQQLDGPPPARGDTPTPIANTSNELNHLAPVLRLSSATRDFE